MARPGLPHLRVWVFLVSMGFASAQDGVSYGSGSMAGAVIGTFLVTLALVAVAYLFYKYYWKNRKDKSQVLVNDPENVKDEFAFDNPSFKTETVGGGAAWLRAHAPPPLARPDGKEAALGPNPALAPSRPGNFKDDTYFESIRGRSMVPLWSRDFTGLGFEVAGGMRDGIHVSSVLRGGPAAESGRIHTGDRINSVTISFRHMVYEDAVAILSYASPYELRLEVEGGAGTLGGGSGVTMTDTSRSPLVHPKLRRVASHADVSDLEKATKHHYPTKPQTSPNSTLETSHKNTSAGSAIKKNILDKIHTSATLERIKHHQQGNKERKDNHNMTTLERENEKNTKNKHHMDISPRFEKMKAPEVDPVSKPERNKNRNSTEIIVGNAQRISAPPDVVIIKDGGDRYSAKVEKIEVQKRESDQGKKGMKFGIRVLPPNVPDDGTIIPNRNSKYDAVKVGTENGNVVAEIKSIDEVDKNFANNVSVKDTEVIELPKTKQAAPIVAKRREKPLAPVPNARNLPQNNVTTSPGHIEIKMEPENRSSDYDTSFNRSDDLNSSGIKRDAMGIPQEIPQHMMEAAMFARNNRKSTADLGFNEKVKPEVPAKKETAKIEIRSEKESNKNNKKSKGKAPSPPEGNMSKSKDDTGNSSDTDYSNATQDTVISIDKRAMNKSMNFTDNFNDQNISDMQHFIDGERNHSSNLQDSNKSDDMILGKINTSTPKVEKVVKRMRPEIPTQKPVATSHVHIHDDIDSYDIKPHQKKEASDSLNNYFEDSKCNVSSNFDMNSVISLSQDSFASNLNSELDKIANASTTIELNSSDITIHSSPTNESENPLQESDDNERKAASLGDLSRLEPVDKSNRKPSQGTLERAQSLDITSEDGKIIANEKHITPKKRKSNSVFDGSYYDDASDEVPLDSNENVSQLLTHSKEPRLSLNISMEGLSTFQRNRLKKASEWGNLEDAILIKKEAGSSHSGSSEIANSMENLNQSDSSGGKNLVSKALEEESAKLNDEINKFKNASAEGIEESIDKVMQKTNEMSDKNRIFNAQLTGIGSESSTQKEVTKLVTDLPSSSSISVESQKNIPTKPEVHVRTKQMHVETTYDVRPNFEIGTYVSDPNNGNKYKTDNTPVGSSRLSPKLEDRLTMIYDTNIPDDIKVSRHTLVSSLERPKSDLMKKLLAQNPALSAGIDKPPEQNVSRTDLEKNEEMDLAGTSSVEKSSVLSAADVCNDRNTDAKTNATTFTLLNQPDIVNLRIKQTEVESIKNSEEIHPKSESEFISNINIVGATSKNEPSKINFNFDSPYPAASTEKAQPRSFFSTNDNVVTITTDGSQPSSIITIESDASGLQNVVENYRNSIEIKSNFDDSNDDTSKMTQSETEQSLYNEIISELQKTKDTEDIQDLPTVAASSKTYLIEGGSDRNVTSRLPYVIDTKTLDIPGQKTVTVNVTEDEQGNKIITQNVEQTVTRLVTVTSAPIEVEEFTFGVIKNPTEADYQRLEQMEAENIDRRVLSEIEKQNPNIKFLSSEPAYTNTETMTVNANMTEDETRMFLEKLKNNPQIIMGNTIQHTPGIVIKETSMVVEESGNNSDPHQILKVSQASYKFKEDENTKSQPIKIVKMIESGGKIRLEDTLESNHQINSETVHKIVEKMNKSNGEPTRISDNVFIKTDTQNMKDGDKNVGSRMEIKSDSPVKDYVTEIEVRTPRTEEKQKSDMESSKESSSQNISFYMEPMTFNEVDPSFMGDFLNNERRFSEKEKVDSEKFERRKSFSPESVHNGNDSKKDDRTKRHSDFDLPRNTHIKFRTATYEPHATTPNRLTSSEKRLSQIEILKSNFEKGSSESLTSPSSQSKPLVSTKPSNIPIKMPDKQAPPHKTPMISPSKIPVLHSSSPKALSQENLTDKGLSIHNKTSPHGKLSTSTGNITITSIKSSSRNPSGK